ncbi:MAG: hypothetical protein ACODAB_01650 [Gemmatimonadota bacterium]
MAKLRRNAFRIAAGVLVLGAVVHVATVWPRVLDLAAVVDDNAWAIVAAFALSAVTALAACGLALLLLWKVPDRPDARALTLFLAFLAIFWGSLFRFLQIDAGANELSFNLSYGGNWVSQTALAAFVGSTAAFLRFSVLFPRPLTPDRLRPARWRRSPGRLRRWFLRPSVVWGTAFAIFAVQRFLPSLAWRLAGSPDTTTGQLPPALLAAVTAGILLIGSFALAAVVLGARNLLDSYRGASDEERSRILWVVTGFNLASWMVVGALGLMLLVGLASIETVVLSAAIPLALVLAPLVLVVSAAVGILYAGAIDPALALRRSTVYGALGTLGVLAFAALESAVAEWLESRLELPGFVGSVTTGVMVTAALLGLRRAARGWLGRRAGEDGSATAERFAAKDPESPA